MNGAGSKAKGSSFERHVCKALSRWLTRGLRDDLFWRSAMSGGRATVRLARGGRNQTQLGDVTSIDPEGNRLTDRFLVECKSYRDLKILGMMNGPKDASGKSFGDGIASFWARCYADAHAAGRWPMLIAKQNRLGEFVVLCSSGVAVFAVPYSANFPHCRDAYILPLDVFLATALRPTPKK